MIPTADRVTVASALASAALIALILMLFSLMFFEIPKDNRDLFNVALMALISCVSTGFGYFLGSSEGSKKKDELIGTLAKDEETSEGGRPQPPPDNK